MLCRWFKWIMSAADFRCKFLTYIWIPMQAALIFLVMTTCMWCTCIQFLPRKSTVIVWQLMYVYALYVCMWWIERNKSAQAQGWHGGFCLQRLQCYTTGYCHYGEWALLLCHVTCVPCVESRIDWDWPAANIGTSAACCNKRGYEPRWCLSFLVWNCTSMLYAVDCTVSLSCADTASRLV